ncbi:MAG TPA: response regulator [Alphaproteobacteria bacterium]|nr:response regulator [Alphaproteobacteria bacterium]HOO49890.1 response regulator [Alphaproteobacteria bacterium]
MSNKIENNLEVNGGTVSADGLGQMKSNLLATMSHELRTPMQSVFGFLELMLLENPNEKMKEMIDQAMVSASGVLEILDDILDVAKIDADKMTLEKFEVPVRTLVRGVMEALEPKVQNKSVELIDDISADVPLVVIGDPKRLRQILINLAGNAVKFTSQGHVTLRVRVLDHDALRLRFEIEDSGIGLSHEAQLKLFQPFVQADNSTSREFGGTGLGLSICRKLVELMGGEIGVGSELGKGTTFWFEVPVSRAEDASPEPLPDLTGLSILSIEDHPMAAREIVSTLTSMGAKVESCRSSAEAREILTFRPFDVVISDQSLSDGNNTGLEIIRYAAEKWPRSGLVMYTARDDAGLRQSLKTLGAVYLEKPASRRGLGEAVTQVAARQCDDALKRDGKILVAEDTDSVRMMLARQFETLGVAVDFAQNGVEALEFIQTQPYRLVLSDLHMPRMDGYGLIKEIRTLDAERGEHLPVILLTADIQMSGYRSYMPIGFDECLLKPVSLGALRQMLVRWGVPMQNSQVLEAGISEIYQRKQLYEKVAATRFDEEDHDLSYFSLDMDVLKEQMGDLDASALDMLAQFPAMMTPLIQKLQPALDAQSFGELKEVAHSLKGAARSAGAMRLGDLCEALQKEAESQTCDPAILAEALREFSFVERDIAILCRAV